MKAVLLLIAVLPSSPPEAQFLDGMARDAYAKGRFADALTLFGEVAEEAPAARVFYNMAVTAELAGDRAFAYSLFDRYLGIEDADELESRRTYARRRMEALARKLARVHVDSAPPKAAISIDGRSRETFAQTPATLVLSPGKHQIRVSAAGFVSASIKAIAQVGKTEKVHVVMARQTGQLRVDVADVADAQVVLVDASGNERNVPPNQPTTVSAGAFKLTVAAPLHKAYSSPIVIPANGSAVRTVRLVPLPPEQVKVLVRCQQGRRALWIDGVRRADTPLAVMLNIGEHVIEIREGSEVLWREPLTVSSGRNILVDIDLEAPAAQR